MYICWNINYVNWFIIYMSKTNNISTIVKIALYISLLVVASYITIPIPFTPVVITLHTIILNVIAFTLKPKHAILCVGIYLLMGLVGLPVFSLGTPGIARLLSPAGGYYLGFLVSVFIMSLLNKEDSSFKRQLIIMLCVGIPTQHICAILVMLLYNSFDIINAFLVISLPFIVGDVIKVFISIILIRSLNKITK